MDLIRKENNFNILRLVLSIFVIISHSYPLLGFDESMDSLSRLTNGQMFYSTTAVNAFFVISGYLITISLFSSSSISNYLRKRVLRIFPAFWVVIIFSIIFSAFFIQTGDILSFFTQDDTLRYVTRTPLLLIQYIISGVFSNNPMKAINGSLWTITYEFFFYIVIIPFFYIKSISIRKVSFVVLFIFFLFNYYINSDIHYQVLWYISSDQMYRLGAFFFGGACLSLFKDIIFHNKKRILFISFMLIFISLFFRIYTVLHYVLLPPFILTLAFNHISFLTKVTPKGDYSYGVYLYAFFIQQSLIHFCYTDNPFYLTIITIPISVICGYFSWHFVEKKALVFKNKKIFGVL